MSVKLTSPENRDRLRKLARLHRRAMVILLVYVLSVPGFAVLCYALDHIWKLRIRAYPYDYLAGLVAFVIILYIMMVWIILCLGRELDLLSLAALSCVFSICIPFCTPLGLLITLFALVRVASRELINSGIEVGFFGVDPSSVTK